MKIQRYIQLGLLLLSLVLLHSCEENTYEFGDIITPSNINIVAEIIGQDATNPNGDGSGVVNFTATADDALSFKFVYNGSEATKPDGKITYNFSELGVNTYTVSVVAIGTGGVSSSKTIQVDVLALYSAPDDLKQMLYGFDPANPDAVTSKTWRIKSEVAGHFGLGPVGGTVFGEWYQASANEKDGVGMYDDRFIFNSDGTFQHVTNGTVFGRGGLIDELSSIGGSGGTADNADILNYSLADYTGNWSLIAPGGVETIALSGLGFIGYYIGNHEYQIFNRQTPNELALRITDANNEFDWWFLITSEEPDPSSQFVFNTLVWEDDFTTNGTPDSSKWTYDIGTGTNGWGNNEVQYYTDRTDNAVVENGNLVITAKRENFSGSNFTSARLKTQGLFNFKYGRVEVRAKLPEGAGTWPAIWMLGSNFPTVGWPFSGEIDIMEQTGADKNTVLATCHWQDTASNTKADFSQTTAITNATSEFHLYTLEWTETSISMYLDNTKYYELTNSSMLPFNQDFFLILNVAMGGTLGGTIDAGFSEAKMEIDYVKVFQ
ncbi:glycoside hydrolase family 16 protein [uncultured Tenacibaculum sp.]|uniref:glycoside hydrolase family 16 protein n=1 Tax=uncultured Tenacibaculum sp. TaxID=174713 RepID=UPI00261C27BD|nr:glycoside hydrolase family 16 protein [uncultured Tenacibaculum sp.]